MKKIVFLILLIVFFLSNSGNVKAAFDLESKEATYDPNKGLITIYSDFTAEGDYSINFNKIKLGNNNIKGTYKFEKNMLKIYINNKDIINNQKEYITEGIISNNLFLEKGAIVRSYRPPNSINIVSDSPSNEIILNTHIIALRPAMRIDSFTTDITTLNSNGGDVKFLVKGTNLTNNEFEIRDSNSTMKYKMNVENTQASISIRIPPYYLEKDVTIQYTLYCNGAITDKKVLIIILAKPIEKEDSDTVKPDNNLDDNREDDNNIKTDDNLDDNRVDNSIKPDITLDNNNIKNEEGLDYGDSIIDDVKNNETESKDEFNDIKKDHIQNTLPESKNNADIKKSTYGIYFAIANSIILIGTLIYFKNKFL